MNAAEQSGMFFTAQSFASASPQSGKVFTIIFFIGFAVVVALVVIARIRKK